MAVQKSCGLIFVAIVAVLACTTALPLRSSRQASLEELSIKELVKSLRVVQSVMKSEFKQLGNYEDITDVPAFLQIVDNITKMVELQTAVSEQVAEQGEDASVQLNSTNILLDMVINNGCNWIKSAIHNESFSCSTSDLKELRLMFQMESFAIDISEQLTKYKPQTGIKPCEWTHCNLACNPDIPPEVVDYITSRQTGPTCLSPGEKWACNPIPSYVKCPEF